LQIESTRAESGKMADPPKSPEAQARNGGANTPAKNFCSAAALPPLCPKPRDHLTAPARSAAANRTLAQPVFGRHPEERSDEGSLLDLRLSWPLCNERPKNKITPEASLRGDQNPQTEKS
jgi:hypothetical protein